MSGELPTISRGDLWTIEASADDWSQFTMEGRGNHAGRCDDTGPVYSRPGTLLEPAAKMFADYELAYNRTDLTNYVRAHDGFKDIEDVIDSSRLFTDVTIMRVTKKRVLGALESQLEAEHDRVSTAIQLNLGRLVVAYIDTTHAATRFAAARVQEVRNVASQRQFGELQLVLKGKSGAPAVASPTMKRVPGLYKTRDLLK